MKFNVELTAEAERDVKEAYDYISEHGPASPDQWNAGLSAKLVTLESFPERCGVAPETRFRSFPIYQTFYANFRILFVVEGANVFVITVRHGARKRMTWEEVDERV